MQFALIMNEEAFSQHVQQIFLLLTLFCKTKSFEFIISPTSDPYGKNPREPGEAKYRLKGIINAPTQADTVVFDLHADTNSMFMVELSVFMLRVTKGKVDPPFQTQVDKLVKQIFLK
jgi:hypothetical protein